MPNDSSKPSLATLHEERNRLFLYAKQFFFEYLVATDTRDLEETHQLMRMIKENSQKIEDVEFRIKLLSGK
ncbi:hypothetical protein KEJ21_00540 [Candidatus Bathyarchaeota archaeon]|nr:hypothetical protein [Candidatus Bathyarchaeota archaeon]MBS7630047.1 hypothetical protein [Candidatus Bathyarchaeota archaeon]